MRKLKTRTLALLLCMGLITACDSDSEEEETSSEQTSDNEDPVALTGELFFEWSSDGLLKIDLETYEKELVLANDVDRNGFDMSRDGSQILVVDESDSDSDDEIYTLMNVEDQSIVSQFTKYTGYLDWTDPRLSFDKSLIAALSEDNGIQILDAEGTLLYQFDAINGSPLKRLAEWMPDNTLLIYTDSALYRTNASFTQAGLIRTFNDDVWGAFSPSPDGTKIALRLGDHVYMMNADGSDLVQVTDSDDFESWPVFSPDGQYLLVAGSPVYGSGWGNYFYHMYIIPADGALYDLDNATDEQIIEVIAEGESSVQAYEPRACWR